jgi:hypothetical protein
LVSTVVVFASGVALLLVGPSSRGSLLTIHKATFILWLGFTGMHVLAHLSDLPEALAARSDSPLVLDGSGDGRAGRILSLGRALVAGLVLAIVFLPEFRPWFHAGRLPLSGRPKPEGSSVCEPFNVLISSSSVASAP